MWDSPENSAVIFIRGGEVCLMRYCWLIRRTPDFLLWERISSKASTGFLRALTVIFNGNFQSVFALTNRV
jgi:hypothetical protein